MYKIAPVLLQNDSLAVLIKNLCEMSTKSNDMQFDYNLITQPACFSKKYI